MLLEILGFVFGAVCYVAKTIVGAIKTGFTLACPVYWR